MSPALDRVLRIVAAVLLLVQGGVHLQLWFGGYRGIDVIGPMFLVNAAVALVVAVVLVVRGGLVSALAGIVFSFTTLVAFSFSRTGGLFGFTDMRWDAAAITAVGAEVLAVVVLLAWATIATRTPGAPETTIQRDLHRLGLAGARP
ncbi:hypothetical protein BH24ACT2_BH24ACT2_01060 [soil metagenome]|nr:hypothetical protein [Acidimicrobiia bacterium]MBA3956307.1 hypothetical protein [Acidimicrobiia bacterium]